MTPRPPEPLTDWQETARQFAENADYWRDRAEKCEAASSPAPAGLADCDWCMRPHAEHKGESERCPNRAGTHYSDRFRAATRPAPAGLRAIMEDAFEAERATSEGNAWNKNSREFVISRTLAALASSPAPAGLDVDKALRGAAYEAARGALETVAQWDEWAADWLAKHPRAATRPAEEGDQR